MKKMYRVFGADPYPQHFERVTEDVLRRNLVAVVGDSVKGTKKQQKVRARRRQRIVEDAIRKFRNIKQLAAGIGGYKIVIRYDPYNVGNGLGVYILALPLPERFKSKLKPKPKPPDGAQQGGCVDIAQTSTQVIPADQVSLTSFLSFRRRSRVLLPPP